MVHLTLVNNPIAAFGGAAHLSRPDFPVAAGHFPSDVVFTLSRCDEYGQLYHEIGLGIAASAAQRC